MKSPELLNDDGTASIATMVMMSHHAFRRDLVRFARALEAIAQGDRARTDAVREEWQRLHEELHGHHEEEDTNIFPGIRGEHPEAAAILDRLTADHRRIAPLIARGDRAFAALPETGDAAAVITELTALLRDHLALEEAEVMGLLRASKQFPPVESEEMLALFADGFAWACDGIAAEVVDRVFELLPPALVARLPAARAAFAARALRTWGTVLTSESRTPVPPGWR